MTTKDEPDRARDASHRRRWWLAASAIASAVLIAFAGAACTSAADPGPAGPEVDSVGRVDGSNALIALVADGDQVVAYVCDGDIALGERFRGTLVDGRGELRSAGGATLVVALSGEAATGTFTPVGGTPAAFTTTAATADAGLYFADGRSATGPYAVGWVVLADGTQNGVAAIGEKPAVKKAAPRLMLRRDGARTRVTRPQQPAEGDQTVNNEPEPPLAGQECRVTESGRTDCPLQPAESDQTVNNEPEPPLAGQECRVTESGRTDCPLQPAEGDQTEDIGGGPSSCPAGAQPDEVDVPGAGSVRPTRVTLNEVRNEQVFAATV